MCYVVGEEVKFKSEHGSVLTGTVCDSTEDSVLVQTIFGTYSIVKPSSIISPKSRKTSYVDTTTDYSNYDPYDEDDYITYGAHYDAYNYEGDEDDIF